MSVFAPPLAAQVSHAFHDLRSLDFRAPLDLFDMPSSHKDILSVLGRCAEIRAPPFLGMPLRARVNRSRLFHHARLSPAASGQGELDTFEGFREIALGNLAVVQCQARPLTRLDPEICGRWCRGGGMQHTRFHVLKGCDTGGPQAMVQGSSNSFPSMLQVPAQFICAVGRARLCMGAPLSACKLACVRVVLFFRRSQSSPCCASPPLVAVMS